MKFALWGLRRVGDGSYRPFRIVEIDTKNELLWWRKW